MEKVDYFKCLICGERFNKHGHHIKSKHHLTNKQYYDEYIKKNKREGFCLECGKPTEFISISAGYRKFCKTKECVNKGRYKKIKESTYNKYHVDNVFQLDFVKDKSKETLLKHYNETNPMKSEEIKLKAKNTCLKKYNAENIRASDYGKRKCQETWKKNLGVDNPWKSDIVKQKIKETNLKNLGVEHAAQSQVIKEKIKETCLNRYNVESAFQSDKIKQKIKETNIRLYGTEYYSQSREYHDRYPTILQKRIKSLRKNGTFNSSKPEKEIEVLLKKIFTEVKTQYKTKKYPFHCDFYIPSLDLYIEYNGFWTHNKHPFDKNNSNDIKEAEELYKKGLTNEFYMSAYKVWTQSDPYKVETARKNKIKLLVFYNMKEVKDWIKKRKEQKDD